MALKSIFNLGKKEKLQGKYILITGAAQGIGLETARQFAAAGSHLVLTDIDSDRLAAAKKTLKKEYKTKVFTYVVDVADKRAVQRLASQVYSEIGPIDILINNAGIGHHGPMEEMRLSTWQRLIDINLWGPLYHIYAFLPMMKEQGKGHIVNVSSGQAFFKLPTWGAYASIKMAMGAISEILYYELKKYDIKVTTVYPYMVNTGFYNEVETNSLGAKLSMKLLPLYAQKPQTVAKKIYKAVHSGKRVEMVNVLNNMAKGLHFFNPVSRLFSQSVNFALSYQGQENSDGEIITHPLIEKAQEISFMLSSMAHATVGEIGFEMEEIMSGEQTWLENKEGREGKTPMEFKVTWGTDSLLQWANPFQSDFMCNDLQGTVSIGGFCENARCFGRLELKYFSEQKITYFFEFEGDDGQDYEFRGEKREIYPWNLPWSHTCCFGELRKVGEDKVLATSITHFELNTLPAFIKSFKLLK